MDFIEENEVPTYVKDNKLCPPPEEPEEKKEDQK